MVGRTNALLHSMVSSVNGKTGIVVLDPNDIAFDPNETYSDGTVGAKLQPITTAQIDSLYGVTGGSRSVVVTEEPTEDITDPIGNESEPSEEPENLTDPE